MLLNISYCAGPMEKSMVTSTKRVEDIMLRKVNLNAWDGYRMVSLMCETQKYSVVATKTQRQQNKGTDPRN